jgi:hypothetical protein
MHKSPQKRLREFARNRFDYCIYCGETSDDLTADHIHPRKKGGSTSHWNLVPACIECNQRKGTRDCLEWWKRSVHWEDAVESGRVEQFLEIMEDQRSLAQFLTDVLDENPSFKVRFEKVYNKNSKIAA